MQLPRLRLLYVGFRPWLRLVTPYAVPVGAFFFSAIWTTIFYGDENFSAAPPERREAMLQRFGVLYQSGALFSSLTLAENVMLLRSPTKLGPSACAPPMPTLTR